MSFLVSLKKQGGVWTAAWIFGASVVLLFSCVPAFSQGSLGTIQGAITSMAGGPVAGATVTVIDLARGEARPLMTDESGLYSASGLTAGAYTVRVEAMGFKTMEHTGINLPVGSTLVVDFAMQPGAASEVVTITAEVLPANAATEVTNRAVTETPINGRNFENLIESRNTGQTNLPGANGSTITSNGLRSDQSMPLIDGVYDGDINTGYKIVNGFGFEGSIDPNSLLPLDAIGEITNNSMPKAEIGYHPGNVSNVGIKSGTNTLHGSAYAYGRDTDMNTRNPFRAPDTGYCPGGGLPVSQTPVGNAPLCSSIAGAGKTPYSMNQWGASIGGKIKRDRLFYFLNYERQRYNVGATVLDNSPTTASIQGLTGTANAQVSIPDAIAAIVNNPAGIGKLNQLELNLAGCGMTAASGNVPAHIGLTVAEAQAMVGDPGSAFAPFCSQQVSVFNNGGPTAPFAFGAASIGGPDSGLVKIDDHINDKNAVNGEIFVDNTTDISFTKISTEPWWELSPKIRMYIARGAWVYSPNSTMVNEARFGMDWLNQSALPSDCAGLNGAPNFFAAYGMETGGFNSTCEMPNTSFAGSTGGFTGLSYSPNAYFSAPRNYQGLDSVTWTHGKHIIKFGGEIHRGVFSGSGGGSGGPAIGGTLSYGTTAAFPGANALEDFLTGTPTSGTVYVGSPTGITPDTHINYYAAFIQDTYRLSKKVTVDVGLRYEYAPPFTNPGNQFAFYNPASCAAATGAAPGSMTSPNCSAAGFTSGFTQETAGGTIYYKDWWRHNFGPRAAIAWDVFGTGKTVVRALGNIMYAEPEYTGLSGMQNVQTGADFYNPNGTFFTNQAGQNLVNKGTVQINSGIPFNVCNPALPGGITCTQSQTFYGTEVSSATPACGDGLTVGTFTNPAPCTMQVTNPNLYTPYYSMWALNLQQALGKNMSLVIGYLGNHGNGLRELININQPLPGPNGATAEQERRPLTTNCPNGSVTNNGVVIPTGYTSGPCEPWIGLLTEISNSGVSNYDALQATLSMRNYHGVTFDLNYTLAHCLETPTTGETAWNTLENSLDPQSSYGTCSYGQPQRITANVNWAIPGRHSPGQLLEGWAVNGTVITWPLRYASGAGGGGMVDTSDDISGTGNDEDHWNIFGSPHNFGPSLYGLGSNLGTFPCFGATGSSFVNAGCTGPTGTIVVPGYATPQPAIGPGGICTTDALKEPGSPSTVSATTLNSFGVPADTALYQLEALGCYVSGGAVMLPPSQGTFGDMSSNCCLQPGYFNVDISVTKTWGFMKEQRVKAQFRAEAFNVFNNVNYGSGGINLGSVKTIGQFTSTPNTGTQIVTGAGGEREVQLGLKFIW